MALIRTATCSTRLFSAATLSNSPFQACSLNRSVTVSTPCHRGFFSCATASVPTTRGGRRAAVQLFQPFFRSWFSSAAGESTKQEQEDEPSYDELVEVYARRGQWDNVFRLLNEMRVNHPEEISIRTYAVVGISLAKEDELELANLVMETLEKASPKPTDKYYEYYTEYRALLDQLNAEAREKQEQELGQ